MHARMCVCLRLPAFTCLPALYAYAYACLPALYAYAYACLPALYAYAYAYACLPALSHAEPRSSGSPHVSSEAKLRVTPPAPPPPAILG